MSASVVYDTMLFLQAAARPARTHACIAAMRDGRVSLFVSEPLLSEVRDVLTRPEHIARFPSLTAPAVAAFLEDILMHATFVDAVPSVFTWPQHSDDDHLFNLAIKAQVEYVITWETRILNLLSSGTAAAKYLNELSPRLKIITPEQLTDVIPRPVT